MFHYLSLARFWYKFLSYFKVVMHMNQIYFKILRYLQRFT